MVFYFKARPEAGNYTIFMGLDKHENEELIRYGFPEDIWFHVDKMSSAHVYLRLNKGQTIDDISEGLLEDCTQLVKANSIQGNKMNNVDVVYTPWYNLKKTPSMDVAQVGFHNPKMVRTVRVEKRINEIVNRLNKTKVEWKPDLKGMRTYNLKSSNEKEAEALGNPGKEDEVSQITLANASVLSVRLVPGTAGKGSLEQDATCLRLGQVGTKNSSANVGCDAISACNKETSGPCFPAKVNEEHEHNKVDSVGLSVDLNVVDVSSMVEQNPFYPYKMLGQMKSGEASECGSTTDPPEESEPLRMWKEMKQNGFLSSSHGGIPMPKQRGRQPRKRKDDEPRRKAESARREQANRFTKIAAPSGLLSGLNPGIINHVRNSKQVHSIIEAIVRSEKLDEQTQNRSTDQMGRESKDTNDRRKEHNYAHVSATHQLNVSLNKPSVPSSLDRSIEMNTPDKQLHCGISTNLQKDDNDALTLKLSSAVTETSENAYSASTDNHSANQDNITPLSLKAATVASQWLDLLQQDIKGRLAALRRSKKRVRNAIQTELPYLLSTEFSSNQENDPSFAHSSEAQCSKKHTPEMHVARWSSLFSQMDRALYEEGKHLENWLKQVQEMQLHCENGLKYVCVDGLSQLGSSEDSSKLKKSEVHECECAVRAAAASIYSTCNLIMTTENVPCF